MSGELTTYGQDYPVASGPQQGGVLGYRGFYLREVAVPRGSGARVDVYELVQVRGPQGTNYQWEQR